MHIRFYFTIINLLFFSFGYSQKNQLLNVKLYNNEILLPINNWYNNELLSDTKIDNFLYFKIDNKYYKKANTTEIIPQLFGAKANGQYNLSDDTNSLIKGDDDDKAIIDFLINSRNIGLSLEKFGATTFYFPTAIYKSSGSYTIRNNGSIIFGDGSKSTLLHSVNSGENNDTPFIRFKISDKGSTSENLLSGGGLEKISIRTNNANIRNFGLNLVFTEYLTFRDVNIEGFGKSAIKGGFWESYFENIKIGACGALQLADNNGNPITGVIDTSNDDPIRPDSSNNTLFNKLTLSSNFGTWLKLTATSSQTVNININGLYAESYYGDAGDVDNLPIIYVSNATGNSINGGFITINSTNKLREADLIKMDKISEISLSNLVITFNPIDGYLKRPIRRLTSIANLKSINSKILLRDVTINDQVDGIGYGLDNVPPLINGIGICNLYNVTFKLLSLSKGGTRRLTNLIDKKLITNGSIQVLPNDENGEIPSLNKRIDFINGSMIVYDDFLPKTNDTWSIGDKILKNNVKSSDEIGWICIQDGTTGVLNIKGTGKKNTKTLKVDNTHGLLKGDWIQISNLSGYNRVSMIKDNVIYLEQLILNDIENAVTQFLKPKWEIIKYK